MRSVPRVLRFAPPEVLTPRELERLQQSLGNEAVAQLVAQRLTAIEEGKKIDLKAPVVVVTTAPAPVGDGGGFAPHSDPYTNTVSEIRPEHGSSAASEHEAPVLTSTAMTTGPTSTGASRPLPTLPVFKPLKTTTGYTKLKARGDIYANEFTKGSNDLPKVVEILERAVAENKINSVAQGMQFAFGWSAEDCAKYLDKIDLIKNPDDHPDKPLVYKMSEHELPNYELHGGSNITQGDPPVVYDTGTMFSKFMGSGFAIFVMDKAGKIYSAQHKVGLFHHSSFLAGGAVAGAGEMKVESGTLKTITNKSGHYRPTAEEMVQVLDELYSRGVDLKKVDYVHKVGTSTDRTPWGKAFDFLNRYKHNPGLADRMGSSGSTGDSY
ncbi:hypothetical protein AB6A68_08855 [Ferrimicrobium acidiphilum]|uniref:N-acetylmuramoyl-L-alanine amidase domain-containing protein n=1 Tax=Ferrimicrobium acidiphilum TaxID=121039 RepID=A0ABV3Y308_9ACTN